MYMTPRGGHVRGAPRRACTWRPAAGVYVAPRGGGVRGAARRAARSRATARRRATAPGAALRRPLAWGTTPAKPLQRLNLQYSNRSVRWSGSPACAAAAPGARDLRCAVQPQRGHAAARRPRPASPPRVPRRRPPPPGRRKLHNSTALPPSVQISTRFRPNRRDFPSISAHSPDSASNCAVFDNPATPRPPLVARRPSPAARRPSPVARRQSPAVSRPPLVARR
jgi:hypothetical protein